MVWTVFFTISKISSRVEVETISLTISKKLYFPRFKFTV
jgi:hypothetical protein